MVRIEAIHKRGFAPVPFGTSCTWHFCAKLNRLRLSPLRETLLRQPKLVVFAALLAPQPCGSGNGRAPSFSGNSGQGWRACLSRDCRPRARPCAARPTARGLRRRLTRAPRHAGRARGVRQDGGRRRGGFGARESGQLHRGHRNTRHDFAWWTMRRAAGRSILDNRASIRASTAAFASTMTISAQKSLPATPFTKSSAGPAAISGMPVRCSSPTSREAASTSS